MADEMVILTRMFDLLASLLPKGERFPKPYRFTVTQRMMDAALNAEEALFDAMSQGGTTRQRHLRAADAALNKPRLYLRLAHRWQWLNDGQYRHASLMVAEIGRLRTRWAATVARASRGRNGNGAMRGRGTSWAGRRRRYAPPSAADAALSVQKLSLEMGDETATANRNPLRWLRPPG